MGMKEYALYKGENILALGTIDEIAKKMGVKKETIACYKTPSYKSRIRKRDANGGNARILICLDDEEDLDSEGYVNE